MHGDMLSRQESEASIGGCVWQFWWEEVWRERQGHGHGEGEREAQARQAQTGLLGNTAVLLAHETE